jgi:GNAT superfamily N-acetyltransferase
MIETRTLTPELVDDWLEFFDGDAFADNTWWCGCYCFFYHSPGDDWDASADAREPHRAAMETRIRSGRQSGVLAYIDGKVAGWVNAGARDRFENPRVFASGFDDTPDVGSIMCFVVSPNRRREGVASALLDGACDMFRRRGLRYAEGYPTAPRDDIPWTAASYHGPLQMYLDHGFAVVTELERFCVVRRSL